jgi:hypothetical protein
MRFFRQFYYYITKELDEKFLGLYHYEHILNENYF